MVPFERALVSSYMPHSNFSSIFTRFRDIAAFVLHCSTPLLPSSLQSPPNFPMFPWERWMAFGLRRAKVLAQLSVQLVYTISDLCDPDPPTQLNSSHRRTDRQTDVQSQYRTLHRAVTSSYIGSVPDLKCSSAHMLWCVSHYITRESLT